MSAPTIVVSFGDSVATDDQFFIVELDGVLNVDSAGEVKTQFQPEDDVFFLMHYDKSKLRITDIKTTDSQVVVGREVTRSTTTEYLFVDPSTPQELTYIPDKKPEPSWYGNESALRREGRSVYAASCPCIGDITYEYKATSARLAPPDITLEADETYPVAIVIYVEAV